MVICFFVTVFIFIEGYAQTNWYKDTVNNPVLKRGSAGEWDSKLLATPYVTYDGNLYQMWYTGSDITNGARIGYAHSADGFNWTKYDDPLTTSPPYAESDPVLITDSSGSWDGITVFQPCVLFEDDSLFMWFSGHSGIDTRKIGLAYSTDTLHWEKYPSVNPVLTQGDPGEWDDEWVDSPEVLLIDGIYHMWYSGYDGTNVQIGHATSTDRINWEKDTLNPVLTVGDPGKWDDHWCYQPSVFIDGDGTYHIWYSGGHGGFLWNIGYATSPDGRNWTKSTLPVLDQGLAGDWDHFYVGLCGVVFNSDLSIYKMWYSGGFDYAAGEIGYAFTSPVGVEENKVISPQTFAVSQNFPNPFNPATTIKYQVSDPGLITIVVYNVLGEAAATLVNEMKPTGSYEVKFDGAGLPSGLYFYRLSAEGFSETKKMLLLK